NVSPVWNPKTGQQLAYVSGRSGLPQIYISEADGTNVQRMTETGYAVSPSWSPNGQFLAFAWRRNYGPGAPGGQDIYVMDIASKQWVQLTHDSGVNDFPSWSPDGRHIVFDSTRGGSSQIWSMLADGSQQPQLTRRTQNANDASVEGIGSVELNGSKTVTPSESTSYKLLAKGPGGTADAVARVTVTEPVREAPAPPPSLSDEQWWAQNVQDIYFDYDSYAIRPDAQQAIAKTAQALAQKPNFAFTVEGHCDDRGSTEYNIVLGEERAKAVKNALVAAGVNASRINTTSFGKEKPFCSEETEACWQQNRRGHFTLKR